MGLAKAVISFLPCASISRAPMRRASVAGKSCMHGAAAIQKGLVTAEVRLMHFFRFSKTGISQGHLIGLSCSSQSSDSHG